MYLISHVRTLVGEQMGSCKWYVLVNCKLHRNVGYYNEVDSAEWMEN